MQEKITESVRELAQRIIPDSHYYRDGIGPHRPRFALFLGAGASIESGIRGARSMIEDFIHKICAVRVPHLITLEDKREWLIKDGSIRESEYGSLFQKCFPKESDRRDYIEGQVDGKVASIGYVALANLLEKRTFDTVITTNFDDLIYQACTSYTARRPVVFSLGGYATEIGSVVNRARILKIHGDFLFSDIKNTGDETRRLELNFAKQLSGIFETYKGLVVIGYEGSDSSVMDLLFDKFPRERTLFWCVHKDSKVNPRVEALLKEKGGFVVRIKGFDDLMMEIYRNAHGDYEHIISSSSRRSEELCNEFLKFSYNQIHASPLTDIKHHDWQLGRIRDRFGVLFHLVLGNKALLGKQYEEAEALYKRATEIKDTDADSHYSYAQVLALYKDQLWKAEEEYVRAISLNPADAYAYNRYGKLLSYFPERWGEAEKMHRKAIDLNENYSFAYFELANLLVQDSKRLHEAEANYLKAIRLSKKPEPAFYYKLCELLQMVGRKTESRELYRSAAKEVNFLEYFIEEAIKSKLLHDSEAAFKYANRARKHASKDHYSQARIYSILNEPELALNCLELAISEKRKKGWDLETDIAFKWVSENERFKTLVREFD